MATPDYKIPNQEMPPPGGFRPVTKLKGPVTRGPPGWSVFLGLFILTSTGYALVGHHNQQARELARDARERRIAILPFLQAELDIEALRNQEKMLAIERETMKNVPGWVVGESTYHSKKYTDPVYTKK